ncbi:MAG: GTP cyclohydrolase I FolE [Gemmata sp.]|nr:GTP cyclohydrolase I FolE [Gemmata sp.]
MNPRTITSRTLNSHHPARSRDLNNATRNSLPTHDDSGPLGSSHELEPLPVDHARLRRAVRELLIAIGEDPDREGLIDTPDRVARMYAEIFAGLHTDPAVFLQKTFTQKHDEMVLVKDIEFSSMCEHHLLPFFGKAHIAYLPNGQIVGLSKLARVVDAVARRPQVQERMTEEIADLIMTHLNARGVGVIIEAAHTCMSIRGVRKPGAKTITSSMRGGFLEFPATRAELMSLVFGGSR